MERNCSSFEREAHRATPFAYYCLLRCQWFRRWGSCIICHLPWSADEFGCSSTWRELQALHVCLSVFCKVLSGCAAQWFTDNRNILSIIRNESMKPDLHRLSLCIFKLVLRNNIDLQVDWIPRSLNEHTDTIKEVVDFDDWGRVI